MATTPSSWSASRRVWLRRPSQRSNAQGAQTVRVITTASTSPNQPRLRSLGGIFSPSSTNSLAKRAGHAK